jgi:glycerol-3-phosphate cytidylyltransferase
MKKTILTYGTFDLFHIGHLRLLERLGKMGDELIVGVSTDEFNEQKGKKSFIKFEDRIEIVKNIKYVAKAIPENTWMQKIEDVKRYNVTIFAMGDDWIGKFDELKEYCEVHYLPRTAGVSSTEIKKELAVMYSGRVDELKNT